MGAAVLCEHHIGSVTVAAVLGDLTEEPVDAIVNAANSSLVHGGGLAAAIARRGGPIIDRESREIAPVPVGGAAPTSGGELPAQWVIHAVGPQWGEGSEEAKLRSAVRASLDCALELEVRSVALPAISTGIFGYPKDEGTRVIAEGVLSWLRAHPDCPFRTIRLTAFDEPTASLFARALDQASQDQQLE